MRTASLARYQLGSTSYVSVRLALVAMHLRLLQLGSRRPCPVHDDAAAGLGRGLQLPHDQEAGIGVLVGLFVYAAVAGAQTGRQREPPPLRPLHAQPRHRLFMTAIKPAVIPGSFL